MLLFNLVFYAGHEIAAQQRSSAATQPRSRSASHITRDHSMRSLFAAAFTCLLVPMASAQPRPHHATGPDLITHVRPVADLAAVCAPTWSGVARLEAIAYCQGFLTSAGQYHTLAHPAGGRAAPLYCVPSPGPSVAASGIALAAWAHDHPAYQGEPALDGFLRWAEAAFPCPPPVASDRARRPVR